MISFKGMSTLEVVEVQEGFKWFQREWLSASLPLTQNFSSNGMEVGSWEVRSWKWEVGSWE